MASAYATLAASGVYHPPHLVQKVVNAEGQVLFDAGTSDKGADQRIDKAVADNTTAAMQPIASYSRGHALSGGRASAAKTGTVQLGDSQANKDAWMVGYTPSLSTAVWVGTVQDNVPLVTASGAEVYGSGLPSDIWKSTMDGALKGTPNETFPKPTEIGGYAGVPAPPPPPPPAVTVIQPTIEVAPGITIPVGPRRRSRGAPATTGTGTTARTARPTNRATATVTGAQQQSATISRVRWPMICVARTIAIAPAAQTLWALPWPMPSVDRWAGTR